MDSSMMEDSVFEDGGSSDFAPVKAKPKVVAKKVAAPKPRAASKKLTQTTLKTTKAAPKKHAKPDLDDENMEESLSAGDDSLLSNTPPKEKKKKSAPATKKTSGKPLNSIANESFSMDGASDSKPVASGSATDRYQKLTQLEHIIKRPDTYIGSIERTEKEMWVFNSETESMQMREVSFVPGLYKIFDEILVNAADNKHNDKNMKAIKVTVNRESGEISVYNDGKGIPIEVHKREGIYIPEMIFGHLLTSSNYDDDQKKVTGGRNGYGAKLCNIYSTQFTIETADSKSQQRYKQTWTGNMSNMGKAKITANKSDDYTKVTFTPDYAKFGMSGMDDDFEALVKRRVYDLAGTVKGVKIWLNGDRISTKISGFKKYMEMYTKAIKAEQQGDNPDGVDAPAPSDTQVILTDNPHERWEIGFAVSDGSFQQVSFVNSIATTSGGTHVNFVADQIVNKLMDIVKKKNKGGVKLNNNQIKNHIFLFVNCMIENPAFTSQTKEQLTTKAAHFGSKPTVSEKFLKDIAKTEAVDNILHFAQKKADKQLAKSDGNRRSRMNHAKLTDANKAGTKDGWRCTLILTEGDSASSLALAGRAVVDPDLIGVFPLRGKVLNVRDASVDQITKNQEIQNIKKFLGLQHKKVYEDTKSLRYGHLMIMTDQDHDGSHIKGLLINLFQVQFPSLLKLPDFLKVFITPIVKVWKGDQRDPKQLQSFFTMPEYEAWKEMPGHHKGWDHKYYKGLGTSSNEDAEVYFRDPDRHLKEFEPMKKEEEELIDLAFSKKKADARKNWLREFRPGTFLDLSAKQISYDDFVNKELILFSMVDNLRSIPSVVDGFKPSQRKVLYTCFRRNAKKDLKVVELAGYVSGLTDYSYGDASLQQTIVSLAQNFVGSNNINCLEPSGNFGSRRLGGNDAASPRYIYTRLSPFARRLFHASDEPLLEYHESDGNQIEPHHYVPILPMILVNGADGIGTGWSTSIPNYKPEDIIENLKIRMAGSKEDMKPLTPWFRGFTGAVEDIGGDRYRFSGIINQTGDNEVEITELPVRMWTQDFKEKLEDIIRAEKVPSFIKDYTEYNTPTKVHFIIKMEDKHMKISLEKGLEETFKLSKTMATTNLVAFDHQGRIQKYDTVLDIMEEFYHVRLKMYEKRKQHLLEVLQKELEKLSNQSRFIQMIIDGHLVVSKKKKAVLVAELQKLNFKRFPKVDDARKAGENEAVVDNDEESDDAEADAGASDYDYLLGMAIWSLTQERVDKLLKQIGDKELEVDALIKKSPKDLWNDDLDDFLAEWNFQLDEENRRSKKRAAMGRRDSRKLGIGGKAPKNKKRKAGDSDDSDFAVPKKKSAKAAPKQNVLTSYLSEKGLLDKEKVKLAKKPSKPATKQVATHDDGNDIVMNDTVAGAAEFRSKDPPAKSKRGRPASSKDNAKQPSSKSASNEDDEDVFMEVAEEPEEQMAPPPTRAARAATKKTAKYIESDDSEDDNGDDLLGDVSTMVKGIGNAAVVANRALFSNSAPRPSSSHGLSRGIGRPSSKDKNSAEESDDATDYTKLVPQPSPLRPAARTANDTILSDDDDIDDSLGPVPVLSKVSAKPAAAKAASKPSAKVVSKAATKASSAASKAASAPAAKTLSPAAKAYAAKQLKAKAAPAKAASKKRVLDEDSDNELANDLLSDEDDGSPAPPPRATSARPGRRAAATAAASKSKYVVSDDEDESEEESEEPSFMDEDSD